MTPLHGCDLEHLRVLSAVVREGSFTAAAAALHYTQSGVSRRIAALEAVAGVALFARRARGVRLTPAGAAMHRHATEILGRVDTLMAELASLRAGTGGRLRIGAFPTANAALVPAALDRLRLDRPGLLTTVREDLTPALLDDVRSGALDVAVTSDYPTGAVDPAGTRLVPLADDPLLVALPACHRLAGAAGAGPVRLADLADESWIEAGRHGEGTMLALAFARLGIAPRVDIRVRSWTAKQGFVAAGLGVTLVPRLAAAAMRPDVVLRPIGDELAPRRVFAALPADTAPVPAAGHAVDVLRQVAATL